MATKKSANPQDALATKRAEVDSLRQELAATEAEVLAAEAARNAVVEGDTLDREAERLRNELQAARDRLDISRGDDGPGSDATAEPIGDLGRAVVPPGFDAPDGAMTTLEAASLTVEPAAAADTDGKDK